MALSRSSKEAHLSVRLLWPFARVIPFDDTLFSVLAREGLNAADFANPDTRIRHRVAIELLQASVTCGGDRSVGLRAGQNMESGDLDALEYAARNCDNLGEAIRCIGRYVCVMNEAAEITLEETGDVASWGYRTVDDVPLPPAANDFVLSFAVAFARRYARASTPLHEVHLMHDEPTDAVAYKRIFRAPVRYGMPKNALLFPRADLALPMQRANQNLQKIFELRASTLAQRYRRNDVTFRVRSILETQLGRGSVAMPYVARKLAMSVPTLRRRLEEEGTNHSALLDAVRMDLALRYMDERRLSLREIAFLIGFVDVNTFNKAFKRWTGGATAAQFRSRRLSAG